ncbi:hypothetical protein FRB97_001522 [Tulasnella sp. 331]|nr:hypothetical protein FRB97_001522 [Tulasnella sp. 331]
MLFSRFISIVAALSFGASSLAHPVEKAVTDLQVRQTVYTPIPDTLSTCETAVAVIAANIQVAVKAQILTVFQTTFAAVVKDLTDAETGVQADANLTLAALLGVYTYEQGVVQIYANIIVEIYNYLAPLVAIGLQSTGGVQAEIALVISALSGLDAALQTVIAPVQPSFVADVTNQVATDLKVSVSICLQVLSDVGITDIL